MCLMLNLAEQHQGESQITYRLTPDIHKAKLSSNVLIKRKIEIRMV